MVIFAVEKLGTFLIEEAELLGSLSKDVRALKNELASIQQVLKDAEKRAEDDAAINEWVRQVREIGFCIEDVIDEYFLLKRDRQEQHSLHNNTARQQHLMIIRIIWKYLRKAVVCVSKLKPKHELASKMKEIKAELLEISSRRDRYKFITEFEIDNYSEDYHRSKIIHHQQNQVCSLFADDSELFGIQVQKAEIIKLLNSDHHALAISSRPVIPLVGMGGIGKTTLVRKVYEDEKIRKSYFVRAWVTVSPSYQRIDLLKSICKQSSLNLADESDEISVIGDLRKHLMNERYIVVFDDVWDAELWKFVKTMLPSNGKNSRILMTTRAKDIALHWIAGLGGGHAYDVKPLNKDVAWDLFCHKAFGNGYCPPELEELSQHIVKKCEGLPLAIAAIGGLCSIKDKVYSEWNKIYSSLGFELGSNQHFTGITKVLLLSYHELPHYLKPCFLYFGLFPRVSFPKRMKLLRLWIAEGFIQNQRGKTLEEVAGEYLDELVNRNLVQFRKEEKIQFSVHDILLDTVIVPKLDNLGFCQVLSQNNSSTSSAKQFRRLSIHTNSSPDGNSESAVRSLLWFVTVPDISGYLSSLLKDSRLLRVLDLENAPIDHTPESLGNLMHLCYLSLKNTKVKVLPRLIGELRNLQTLNLKYCNIVELPTEVGRCQKLRHLLTSSGVNWRRDKPPPPGVKVNDGVLENLKELQKLAYMEADRACLIKEMQHLKQLRSIAVSKVKTEDGMVLCSVIEEMEHLRSLSVESLDHQVLDLQYISTSWQPLKLERLYLDGILEKFPEWITKLDNLARLNLVCSRLEDDPVKKLQALPNLISLVLDDAYVGERLDFGFTCFSKLQKLRLYTMRNLREVQCGDLPALQTSDVIECPISRQNLPSAINKCFTGEQIRVNKLIYKAAMRFSGS